jgi:hypothetical protein
MVYICVGLFPPNTFIALQRLHSLAFGFGPYYRGLRRPLYLRSRQSLPLSSTVWADFKTFAYAKDQASSPLDGLLRKTRHYARMTYLGYENRT